MECEKNENKQKEAGIGPFKKKKKKKVIGNNLYFSNDRLNLIGKIQMISKFEMISSHILIGKIKVIGNDLYI